MPKKFPNKSAPLRVSEPSSLRWIAAFAGVFVVTVVMCGFYEGQAKQMGVEALHIRDAVSAAKARVVKERENADHWHHRYEVLADSAGAVAVMEASIREQDGGK